MKRVDQITSILLLLGSAYYIFEALKMPLIAGKAPGSGWLPLILGIIMLLLAGLLLVAASRRPATADSPVSWPTGTGLVNNVAILGSLAVSAAILPALGYLLATFAFLLVLLLILGRYSWWFATLTASISTAVLYWVFKIWLGIPLPTGLVNIL